MKKILSIAFVLFFAYTTFLQAQNTPQPVKWTFESKKSVKPNMMWC
ncbi:MAG: hypothetical protein IPL35_04160 [Sphingobacteriales bacterium]|nr:hypothetical protein [Sphingobacteriales bacterium]